MPIRKRLATGGVTKPKRKYTRHAGAFPFKPSNNVLKMAGSLRNSQNALLAAQNALGSCQSQRVANAAASAALQTAAVTNNKNKIQEAANIAVNHSKNNPNAPSAQSAQTGLVGALTIAGQTLIPFAGVSSNKKEKVANAVNNAVNKAGNNSPNVVNAATKAALQTLAANMNSVKKNVAMIKAAQAAANAAAKHGNGTNAANAASQAAIIVAQSPNATPAKIEKAANAAANAVASGSNTPAIAAANAAAAANANKPAAAVNAAAKMNTKNNLNKLLNQYNANRAKAFRKFSIKAHPNKGGNTNYFQKVSGLYSTHYKNANAANIAAKQAEAEAQAAANAAKAEANKAAANAAAKAQANANKAAQEAANQAKRNQEAANAAAKAQEAANKAQAEANAKAKAEANAKAANNAAKAKAEANAKAANNAAKAQAEANAKAAANAAKAAQEAANKAAANAAEAAKTKNAENKAAANAAAKAAQEAANKAAANAKAANKLAFNALPGTNNKSLFNNNQAKKAQANLNAIARAKANANAVAAKVNIKPIPGKPNPKIPNTPINNGALRRLANLYKFPNGATTENRIKRVSEDAWKKFLVAKRGMIMPNQAAWNVLKQRGQTVGLKNYKSGFILNKYNWKNLYKTTTNASEKQVMRYILTMLALNPPYANRKTGDRNKLTNNTIGYMSNSNFNAYLNKVRPVANQGGGLVKAALRTTVSGAGLAAKHAKPFVLPIAGLALVSQLGNPALAGPAMSKLKQIIKDRLKEKLKNIPYSNQLVNKLSNAAEKKLASMKNATNNKVINSIENTINTGIKNDPNINRKVNTAVETFVRQQRNIGNINYGEVAKYKNFIRQAIKNGTFNASKAANNYQKKKLAGQLTGLAIASGALAAEGAVGMVGKKAANVVVKGATGNGQRQAAQAAQRIAEKVVKKSRVAINLNKAKLNFIKKQLNRAARGETIPANVINKAIQRAGGNARIGHALEKGGQAALNLLKSL